MVNPPPDNTAPVAAFCRVRCADPPGFWCPMGSGGPVKRAPTRAVVHTPELKSRVRCCSRRLVAAPATASTPQHVLVQVGNLSAARDARLVSLSSITHKDAHLDFDDLMFERGYRASPANGRSKLATTIFGIELDRRLRADGSPIVSALAHHGLTRTNLTRAPGNTVAGLGRSSRGLACWPPSRSNRAPSRI